MCEQCKNMAAAVGKKKKSRVSGMDSDGMLRIAKKAGAVTGGFALGEYTSKMIQDSTTDKTKLPNQGVVGIGKVVVAGATAAYVENDIVQDVCVGVMVSGFKDIIIANAADAAKEIGLHGMIDYGQGGNWSSDNAYYPEYGGASGYSAEGQTAAGNTARVAY